MYVDYREFYKGFFDIEFGNEYHIHHIDGNRKNNHIDNLLLLPAKLHNRYHFQKQIIESQPLPTVITGNAAQNQFYYMSCLDGFLETLKECNKWYDYKMFLLGRIPNVHGLEI